ncbi:putative D-lactate dehydrogenase [Limosilactobacillus coleohominis 101-4-CHN]|uniref:Putative D-lactate dehydrogenase n=1 Tax=Limosilactobacillus coleohominis 101-4-CHN TaxID=575594 RepID=C7XX38_9LACO|nr:D-2-hydroxyacid dehydrogenase [Limosilactobacillus coleohominis]EEU29858.1 putative D-lactate dehydrogenase [Limosilactobacillus coleohominis 101-4-CHN]
MKIIMYGTKPIEKSYVEAWEKKTDNTVKMVADLLNDDTVDMAQGFDGVVTQQTQSLGSSDVYKKLASFGIKQIGLRTAGYDMVNLDAANANGITITRVSIYSPRAIAEMGVTQAMYLNRKIGLFNQRMTDDHDFSWAPDLVSNEIFNLTVGIIGLGHIGGATAQIYKALGAKVIAYDPFYDPEQEAFVDYTDLDTVLRESDIITLHTPLFPSTKNIINADSLKKMKKTAYLINMARGGLVDTQALIKALQDGEIAGAGLDTLADETTYFGKKVSAGQVPEDYKTLAAMPNVVVTPHVAFFTKTSVRNMVEIALNDTVTIVNGGKTRNAVR